MEKHPQIGRSYDHLTPLKFTQQVGSKRYWLCRCSCGNDREVDEARLHPGKRNWCRCAQILATKKKNSTHGFASGLRKHPLYLVWRAMRSRCENPKVKRFSDYGGRGIYVCDRWRIGDAGKSGFACFIEDMGSPPSPKHTLERTRNDLPYSPRNCIWATRGAQSKHRRSVYRIDVDGMSLSLKDAAAHFGMSRSMVQNRLSRGWTLIDALSKPRDSRGSHNHISD